VGAEVWGTLAVNDHLRRDALLRQVLLFNQLVIPVPPTAAERERWKHPNAADLDETWDPDWLDTVLSILGTQRRPTAAGSSLAWECDWDQERWQAGRSRIETATAITEFDAFYTTRSILAMDETLPDVVEAIAAYPSERTCAAELTPTRELPIDLSAADALILLAQPLLVPDVADGDYERALTEAAQLARSNAVQHERAAYYDFVRGFVSRLRQPGMDLEQVRMNVASLQLARTQLNGLRAALEQEVAGDSRRNRWCAVEWVLTAVGAASTVGLAFTAPYAAIAAGGGLCSFVGWVAGRRAELPQPRPLNGASLFVTASEHLEVFAPTAVP